MRALNEFFIKELKTGSLKPLLNYVHNDNTLDLQIRKNYINIYYRGGNILKVNLKRSSFGFYFEEKYVTGHPFLDPQIISNFKINQDWNNYFPMAKQAMDYYFSRKTKHERECQQLVVLGNNNSSIANNTDYFIIDIEYDNKANARFDMMAIEWLSSGAKRKLPKGYKPRLVILEMKYGFKSLKGNSGLHKHIRDFLSLKSDPEKVKRLKAEMIQLFKQKRELGLIPCLSGAPKSNSNEVIEFDDEIEMIFLIANWVPKSTILKSVLEGVQDQSVKFFTANFLGYGLFKENVFNTDDFLLRYKMQINNAFTV